MVALSVWAVLQAGRFLEAPASAPSRADVLVVGLSYSLVASSPQWWDACEWWRDERSALVVINEYIRLAYYLVKY